ncbi:hypothetical protein NM208_g8320 [Fusarium decemcellulare]|uniref:Uncharacterized protein n=1 Tax=Fusarium decemcellulare TaxID=57161 RepID=A0ACC1S5U8_9HYPO|nr:hypothetical protein NM208_g8320 [Fusarium decemcellulare]
MLDVKDCLANRNRVKGYVQDAKLFMPQASEPQKDQSPDEYAELLWWELFSKLALKRAVSLDGLQRMMPIIADGMFDAVVVPIRPIELRGAGLVVNPPAGADGHASGVPVGASTVKGEVTMGFNNPEDFKRAMKGKRFVIGLVRVPGPPKTCHTTFILDQQDKAVYVYCAFKSNATGAIRHTMVAIRQLLSWAGIFVSLSLYAPPITRVGSGSDGWAEGFIVLFTLLLNLRGLIGASFTDVDNKVDSKYKQMLALENTKADSDEDSPESCFPLPQRDWVLSMDWRGGSDRIDQVRACLGTIVMDWMGFSDRKYLHNNVAKDVGDWSTPATQYTPMISQSAMPKEAKQFFTNLGGLQIVTWGNIDVIQGYEEGRLISMLPSNECRYEDQAGRAGPMALDSGGEEEDSAFEEPMGYNDGPSSQLAWNEMVEEQSAIEEPMEDNDRPSLQSMWDQRGGRGLRNGGNR